MRKFINFIDSCYVRYHQWLSTYTDPLFARFTFWRVILYGILWVIHIPMFVWIWFRGGPCFYPVYPDQGTNLEKIPQETNEWTENGF